MLSKQLKALIQKYASS